MKFQLKNLKECLGNIDPQPTLKISEQLFESK